MQDEGKKLLELMFRPGETVCVSYNKFGYHSIPLSEAIQDKDVTLVPTVDSCVKRKIEWIPANFEKAHTKELLLVALNPIKGWRIDSNCTAFRNFLVEMDYGSSDEQMAYIKSMGLPYSAAIFSGNKSLHFLISLDTDLSSEKVYRLFSEWILKVITLADQNTKNPSRSIRIPGPVRDAGKRQELVEYKGPVKVADLVKWLHLHPNEKPQEKQERKISDKPDFDRVKIWVKEMVFNGINPPNRNKKWFTVAVEFALSGYGEEYTIDILRQYFSPDRDFKEREWETTVRSAFKWSHERKT